MTSPQKKLEEISKIDALANKALLKPDPRLDQAVKNSKANGLPDIAITPTQGQYLAIQCQLIGAKTILEIGALGGYSTIWLASGGAKVTSVEINPKHRDVAIENTKGLDVEVILGAALDIMPKLAAEGRKFDLVFIDGDWGEQFECFEEAVKLTRSGGCIYLDNVVREILEEEQEEGQTVVEKVGRDSRVTATLVPTVTSIKGNTEEMHDGFLLTIVK